MGCRSARTAKLIGFITAKELLRNAHQPDACVLDIIRRARTLSLPKMDLDDAARILFRYGLSNVPVVDEEGNLIGIISNLDIVRSHIERATPNKVAMVKSFLETKHGITIMVQAQIVPVEVLRPTQHEVFADELLGRMEEIKRGLVEPLIVVQKNGPLHPGGRAPPRAGVQADGREAVLRVRAGAEPGRRAGHGEARPRSWACTPWTM